MARIITGNSAKGRCLRNPAGSSDRSPMQADTLRLSSVGVARDGVKRLTIFMRCIAGTRVLELTGGAESRLPNTLNLLVEE